MEAARNVTYWRMWQNETDGELYFWIHTEDLHNIFGITLNGLFTDQTKESGTLYKLTENIVTYSQTSTAYTLKDEIAKWYVTLRNFALVALLSILVYVGIRIILASANAQEQAKYKKMFIDWLVGVCLLFVLHYIMAFILDITQKIVDIFTVDTISEGGIDYFMTTIRNSIVLENGSYFKYWGYSVMYITLVILTVSFTYQYIKRLIFIALLTMIAPLIALTYPLDKIKDGQAQGFGLWLREYIFNCLIQPVHLCLYVMLVSTSIELMNNPLIAIVALSLFKPAENFLRSLFGFDRASTMSNFGAIAGGAMVMNMLNKMPKGSSNNSKSGNNSANNKGVRTTSQGAGGNNSGGGGSSSSGSNNSSGNNSGNNSGNGGSSSSGNSSGNGNNSGGTNTDGSTGNTTKTRNSNSPSIKRGLKAAGKTLGLKALGSTGRWVLKAGGAFAGATLGVAAGMADGEIGLPVKHIAAGGLAGSKVGDGIYGAGTKLATGATNLQETFERGRLGDEEYERQQAKREFYNSDAWEDIKNDSSIIGDKRAMTEEFLDNGVFDGNVIHEALANDIKAADYVDFSNSGVDSVKNMRELKSANVTAQDYSEFQRFGINDVKKIARVKIKHPSQSATQIATKTFLAEHCAPFMHDMPALTNFVASFDPSVDVTEFMNEIGSYL